MRRGIRMVACDLDGTLLRPDRTISDRTLKALAHVSDSGVEFTIATARPPRFVMNYLPLDFAAIDVVCCNGAELFRRGRPAGSRRIPPEDASRFVAALLDAWPGIRVSLEMDDHLVTNFDLDAMTGWLPPYTKADLRSFEMRPPSKILVGLSGEAGAEQVRGMLPADCSMAVTDGGTLAQVTRADATKLSGVQALADGFGIPLAAVAAFGDDYSDVDMIRCCGTGVAMGNAPEDIRAIADIVAPPNDCDGVAAVLEFLLSEAPG